MKELIFLYQEDVSLGWYLFPPDLLVPTMLLQIVLGKIDLRPIFVLLLVEKQMLLFHHQFSHFSEMSVHQS